MAAKQPELTYVVTEVIIIIDRILQMELSIGNDCCLRYRLIQVEVLRIHDVWHDLRKAVLSRGYEESSDLSLA